MGFFPITPSTEVAENLSKMQAEGQHEIVMIAGDGEHGAAGICYGAALGGGRVLNATSSQGLLYALEQLPVQAGTRVPMVLNVAARAVSGPLDIRGDHSDFYYALNTGWIVLLRARPAGGVRPQLRRHPHRRAPRRAAAGDGGVRRLLHQPPEAPHPGVRRRRGDEGVPRRAAELAHAARHRASGHVRPVHERPGPDQQQGPAVAGDGRGAHGDPAGVRASSNRSPAGPTPCSTRTAWKTPRSRRS